MSVVRAGTTRFVRPTRRPLEGGAWYGLTLAAWVLGMVVAPGCFNWYPGTERVVILSGAMLGWVFMFVGFGMEIANQVTGVLVTGRNRLSLSRLQMTLWTWLILSALMAAAVCRGWSLGAGTLETALSITIGPDLFAAVGISFFTGAATPALLSLKAQSPTDPSASDLVSQKSRETMLVKGQVVSRPMGRDTRLGDLVEGDEVGTAGYVDLSKLQQLMVTVVLIGIYAAMLFHFFAYDFAFKTGPNAKDVTVLPPLSDDFVKLLLLSHAGYLGYKAVPKPPPAADVPEEFGGPPPTPQNRLVP